MSTAATHDWQQKAACMGADPDLWFPPPNGGQKQARQARAICADCPVRTECLAYAINQRIGHGIWGGLDTKDRQKLTGEFRSTPKPINHGTHGGWRTHHRRGEKPCDECKQARSLYLAEKKRQTTP